MYPGSQGPWDKPNYSGSFPLPQIDVTSVTADPTLCQSYHTVMNIGLMDGSVRQITASLTLKTWTNALTPDDGQVLGPDW